jgi:hypothetical protein
MKTVTFTPKFKLCLILFSFTALIGSSWAQVLEDLPDAPRVQPQNFSNNEIPLMYLRPVQARPKQPAFHWKGAATQTFALLTMEQSFRMVQQKTRDHLGGRFFPEWFDCVHNLHGWSDGDSILTNYIGHPIHSSWAGYVEIQNDSEGRYLQFDNSDAYWMSRLRALGWAELYEIQWHLGPMSEASIGHVGRPGTHTLGYVNLVTSAPGGLGLIVLEDWLDKRIVAPHEARTTSLNKRRVYRMLFSPGRAVANLLRAQKPWYRDYRPIDWTR